VGRSIGRDSRPQYGFVALVLRRDNDEAPGHVKLAELIAVDPPPTLPARRRK
jgi:hypothetical protein